MKSVTKYSILWCNSVMSKQLLYTLIFLLIAIPLVGQTTIPEEESQSPETVVEAKADSTGSKLGRISFPGYSAFQETSRRLRMGKPVVKATPLALETGVDGIADSTGHNSVDQVYHKNSAEKKTSVPVTELAPVVADTPPAPELELAKVLSASAANDLSMDSHSKLTQAAVSSAANNSQLNARTNELEQLVRDITVSGNSRVIVVPETNRIDRELANTEIASYQVLIRPNDYLGKISMREYATPNKWRYIYQWNKELIGDDPNVIHPYDQLVLYKPENEIIDPSYDFVIHAAAKGETLWSIAQNWYGDNLAWKVVYSDNAEQLKSSNGRLLIGMDLKIRTSLIDRSEDEDRLSSTY